MRNRSAPQLSPSESLLWSAVMEEAARRRELQTRATRKPLPVRAWRWLWARRRHALPVLVIVGLLVAAMVLRAQHAHPVGVAVLVAAGLGTWWMWRGRHHQRPFLAAVRPVLAGVYLVAAVIV